MKISERTISAIGKIVTGDEGISLYRSGPMLVALFNEYGANDVYGQEFPSRWQYAEEKLRDLSTMGRVEAAICHVLDPREFMDTKHEVEKALDYVNARLKYDGYEVVIKDGLPKILDLKGLAVTCEHPFQGSSQENHLFIDEQIKKTENKIKGGDYDGAITNARSLLEAVLLELEKQFVESPQKYNGDLPKLFKRVRKNMNLDPGSSEIEESLKQILTGLFSIINGLASLSNKMGDRHARPYKPSKHHARLMVNAAKTVTTFLFETNEYQKHKVKA